MSSCTFLVIAFAATPCTLHLSKKGNCCLGSAPLPSYHVGNQQSQLRVGCNAVTSQCDTLEAFSYLVRAFEGNAHVDILHQMWQDFSMRPVCIMCCGALP